MRGAEKILPHYTFSDWESWEGRWELIDGVPYAMAPLPVPRHQQIAASITAAFHHRLKSCSHSTVYQPLDYRVKDDIILQPDMLVVCARITKKYLDFPPALVAEILSPSNFLKDRYTKYSIYETQSIPYYLILSPELEEVEIYRLDNNAYRLEQKGKKVDYTFRLGGCEVAIDFSEIW